MKFKVGQRIIFKDGSQWTVKEVFDNSRIKKHLINLPRFRYTLKGKYSEIFMYEKEIIASLPPPNDGHYVYDVVHVLPGCYPVYYPN